MSVVYMSNNGYIVTNGNTLVHYGTPRHSGRYPWGSGKNPQRSRNWLSQVRDMEKNHNMSQKEIADSLGMTIQQLRDRKTIEINAEKAARIAQYKKLRDKGMSRSACAKRMGISEATLRGWENQRAEGRAQILDNVSNILKERVAESKYIDIGEGSETQLDIPPSRMKAVKQKLIDEGYSVQSIWVPQMGTKNKTRMTVLCPPGTTVQEVYKNKEKITTITDVTSNDGGRTFQYMKPPVSIDSKRIKVRYAEEGGTEKDGTIEIRRGVDDLSLGKAKYAQVRIAVDDTHYMKGVALYKPDEDFPPGVDVIYNSKKHEGASKDDVFKKMKTIEKTGEIDKKNPFGSAIKKQEMYTDKDGNEHQSALNIVNEEGDWDVWSKTLSSQFLSKQEKPLVKDQLKLTQVEYKDRLEDIKKISNPVVRKKELEAFSEECERAAESLKAHRLAGQATKLILPINSLKENECYCPTLENGTRVVLIRHPHAGRFEIPELIVNNTNKEALACMKNAKDAIGINFHAAEQLSGADFDGDTAIVIPNNSGKVKTEKARREMIEFDHIDLYKNDPSVPKTSKETGFNRNMEMGKISNLITDMTEQGAPIEDIIRADKHSMVVIDAEKHNLDWRRSYLENNIVELKKKYQGGANKGASTVVSKSKGEADIPEIKKWSMQKDMVDPETGAKIYKYTDRYIDDYTNKKTGKFVKGHYATTKTTKMKAAFIKGEDATSLLTPNSNDIDRLYADHANAMVEIGNKARLEALNTRSYTLNRQAQKLYENEIKSLDAKLAMAKSNKPKERQAQNLANYMYELQDRDNPSATKEEKTKWRRQYLEIARERFGVNGRDARVHFTEKEWEAIEAHAITASKLKDLLDSADSDNYHSFAMPKDNRYVSAAKKSRIRSLSSRDYSLEEIAKACGVSVSTVKDVLS